MHGWIVSVRSLPDDAATVAGVFKKGTPMTTISTDLIEASERSDTFPADWSTERRHVARQRYEMFLQLAGRHPGVPLAPTRDIDEMWHLHMLSPRAYYEDCMRELGRILDHDGGFGKMPGEMPALKETFNRTAWLWQEAYGEPYVPDAGADAVKCWHDCQSRCWNACKSAQA